ncbi:MAG TPA: adenylyl-sulfate kinase [Candidatus Hydrogenedentes bacterium]|jgi:adenylylsulfate kinase|nr:MAG: putative adenylyl-sulfate kinase [Candidatus Hydrogenedentes bacterium ADurb.Bin170]HNZ48131.1 adenylyl-sulfate kinase [Candidatus Hydrogenedentota bacterium]HOD94323.1 adenylyl-sulfate kinase [Candidatus Hydrogenedentota bacterium]HOH42294.1 adenylyl-sulfate kinase [Candidatus Hydrogenedentota bacterium]HOM46949.1 adenylyl-sulfate kinase [Candidatus Hydrogenedentota bacterium]
MADSIKASNITWHHATVSPEDRSVKNGHQGAILWFTGLSASGKSTVAQAVQSVLFESGCQAYVLDGDNVRHGLNKDLGFSPEDREENIRRIGEVSALFCDAGFIVSTAFISPYRADRDKARALCPDRFYEIFVKCPVEVCETRDPKGLYQKAREGKIPEFTGISAPYEEPEKPELILDTATLSLEACVAEVIQMLQKEGILQA